MVDNGEMISRAFNCKGMRDHVLNALGNVCYSDVATYNLAYSGWSLMACGFLLFFLSLVKLLDVVAHSAKEGGDKLGFELGGF